MVLISFMVLTAPVDMAILLGSSPPNADGKFRAQKSLVKAIIDRLDISMQSVLPAFVSYGPIPTLVSRLGDVTVKSKAHEVVDRMTNLNDSSDLSNALGLVDSYVFSNEQGARPDAAKSVLLFVDKKNSGDNVKLNSLVKKMKGEGTKVVIIGIGDDIDKEALKLLTHKNGAIFFPPNLEAIQRIVQPVYAALLPGK